MRVAIALLLLGSMAHAEPIMLRVVHDAPLERGRAATISLGLTLEPGEKLLEDGPLVVDLVGDAIDPTHKTLHRRDAVDPRAEAPRFELEVRVHRNGTPSLTAHVQAWLCRGRRCRPVEQTSSLPLTLAP